MSTWNDSAPAIGNQIADDIPDIQENFDHLRDWQYGAVQRSAFTYNGGTSAYTIKCKAAAYLCADKWCWWSSELTTTAISAPTASTWYYLYLDYSAITSNTAITNSELIWSTTAPTFSTTYRGWYNGNDRCIFAVYTDSSPTNIVEFFHSDDLCQFCVDVTEATGDPGTAFTDVELTIPGFCTKAQMHFVHEYASVSGTASWRTNGQSNATGHPISTVANTATRIDSYFDCVTDSSQTIEIKISSATGSLGVYVTGWYLPIGM